MRTDNDTEEIQIGDWVEHTGSSGTIYRGEVIHVREFYIIIVIREMVTNADTPDTMFIGKQQTFYGGATKIEKPLSIHTTRLSFDLHSWRHNV